MLKQSVQKVCKHIQVIKLYLFAFKHIYDYIGLRVLKAKLTPIITKNTEI